MYTATIAVNADELHALMGLVMDKRRSMLDPGNDRAKNFYADLDAKLSKANVGLVMEHLADLSAAEHADEVLWRRYLKAVAQGDRVAELTLSRRLFLRNFRRPT